MPTPRPTPLFSPSTATRETRTSTVPEWIQDDHHKLGWLYGAYLQDEWKPAAGLTLNYGLRADESAEYLKEVARSASAA